mgnify:CR=1 FL=1
MQIDVENLANECLLSQTDVKMWLENVKNGKKGEGKYSCKMPCIQVMLFPFFNRISGNYKYKKAFPPAFLAKKQKRCESQEVHVSDDTDDNIYCICMQPWGNR